MKTAVDTVFLLPGQGAYTPGILAAEADSPAVAEVLRTVDRVAGEFGRGGVRGLLTDPGSPSAAELVRTDSFALQLAVFAAAVACARLAEERQTPDVLVGHSMGEIAALTLAGAFDTADGARLVCHRSEALLAHCPQGGAMAALELPAGSAAHLVGAAAVPGLAVAVSNAPRQTVVSGPEEAVGTVMRLTEALGARATRLNAPFPFHSPLLGAAAQAFGEAIAGLAQRPLRRTVYSPVAEGYLSDATDLKALLVRQLTAPVRFLAAVRELHAAGASRFVECGRAGLSGLVLRSVPDVAAEPTVRAARRAGAAPAPAVVPAPVPAAVPVVDAAGVLEELRQLYATTLGYPAEAITGDADLEADLGIDSLKRAEMLGKVAAHFGLRDSAADGRFIVQPTLAELAELVATALGEQSGGPAPAPAVVPAPVPAAVPVVDAAGVLEELRQLYATTLGYPAEAITGDADLEADLGIDSLKRAEMLGKVAAHFGLRDSAADGRFIVQPTLAELAELVAEAQTAAR
ncbi:acyltransferase domain-containing protein [Streptomyces sp. NPDC058662]|uniref:ACP S-malonyltransferase n=1 Tax=Streptomyces sp. NPDC058662 TaxID=3346583 RepID=UPI0036577468